MNMTQSPVPSGAPQVHIEVNELESGTVASVVSDSNGGAIDGRGPPHDVFPLIPSAVIAESNGDIFGESGTADKNLPVETPIRSRLNIMGLKYFGNILLGRCIIFPSKTEFCVFCRFLAVFANKITCISAV
jgi:hypothetical protein